ncbi:AbrB/MazE/SpoVT family DNA-binding domain-containing protein [Phascolarctobacterium sp.]|uniref:AbrB/MazE/SpoVT family DNA-binding domain-containing protein n=1 Tax=Phascolarctobacterium sp. TaxID=2049039 RepID=UPI00386DA6B6
MEFKNYTDNAKVMAKGQITIPKDIREILGLNTGDRVTFIVEGNTVRMVNSNIYAMQLLQMQMSGEAKRTGLINDEKIMNEVKEIRTE